MSNLSRLSVNGAYGITADLLNAVAASLSKLQARPIVYSTSHENMIGKHSLCRFGM